jgi:hypothetical protein
MSHQNPWFLITGEEITTLQNIVQGLRRELPEPHRDRIAGITRVLNEVKDRVP